MTLAKYLCFKLLYIEKYFNNKILPIEIRNIYFNDSIFIMHTKLNIITSYHSYLSLHCSYLGSNAFNSRTFFCSCAFSCLYSSTSLLNVSFV